MESLTRHGKGGTKSKRRGEWSRGSDGDSVAGEVVGAKSLSEVMTHHWPGLKTEREILTISLCLILPCSDKM